MSGRSLVSWLGAAAVLAGAVAMAGGAVAAQGFAGSSVQTVDFVNATLGYAVIQLSTEHPVVKLIRTENGGRTWVDVGRGLPYPKNSGMNYAVVSSLSFSNRSAGAMLVPESPGACQLGFAVYTTANGGRTWRADGQVLGSYGPTQIAQGRGGPWVLNGSCAGPTAALFSKAGGRWTAGTDFTLSKAQAQRYFSPSAVSVERASSGATMEAAAYSPVKAREVARIDAHQRAPGPGVGGWKAVSVASNGLRGSVWQLAMESPTVGVAITGASSARSRTVEVTANGRTWSVAHGLKVSRSDVVANLQYVSATQAFVAVNDVLWSSTDGGASWQKVGRVA